MWSSQGMKWIVARDMDYYPSVESFKTYEEAKEAYDNRTATGGSDFYLAEVKESK